jgi:hypothetical protein
MDTDSLARLRSNWLAHLRDLIERLVDLNARFPPSPQTVEDVEISRGGHRFILAADPAERQREKLRKGLRQIWDGKKFLGFIGGPEDPVEHRKLEQQFREFAKQAGILLRYPPKRALKEVLDQLRRKSPHFESKPLLSYSENVVLDLVEYLKSVEIRVLGGLPPVAPEQTAPQKPPESVAQVKQKRKRGKKADKPRSSAKPPARKRFSRVMGNLFAARRVQKYVRENYEQKEFAQKVGTTARTLRRFFKKGEIDRNVFRNIASEMHTTTKQLTEPE